MASHGSPENASGGFGESFREHFKGVWDIFVGRVWSFPDDIPVNVLMTWSRPRGARPKTTSHAGNGVRYILGFC